MRFKPNIAISMGDPAGISPEIIAMSLKATVATSRPLVFGHWPTLEQALKKHAPGVGVDLVDTVAPPTEGRAAVFHCGPESAPIDEPGEACGVAQLEALARAVDAVLTDDFGALVTAPVAKNHIAALKPGFSGHTEYLAERAGLRPDDVTMVFAADALIVGLVSTHISMRDVPDAVTPKRLLRTFDHLVTMLTRMRPNKRPRIAVAALNPHAGEEGLFGTEEQTLFGPLCETLSQKDVAELSGPLPADAVYRDALAGRYDGVIAAYHDQAMIPLKLAGVGQMVNVTMGLPFIRTSPDHGVAYDIARTGRASPSGFALAFDLAVALSTSVMK
jgi:4-hydroxythreonine-4-phosphate dehydrogenase